VLLRRVGREKFREAYSRPQNEWRTGGDENTNRPSAMDWRAASREAPNQKWRTRQEENKNWSVVAAR